MKGDEERIYWLSRYLEVLGNHMEDQKEGAALFERAKDLEARGAPANEIATIVDQTIKLLTDFRKEETTCINELTRLGDVPDIEKLRSGYETRSAQIDKFLSQAIMYKDSLRNRST
jgi:hypothetical protein